MTLKRVHEQELSLEEQQALKPSKAARWGWCLGCVGAIVGPFLLAAWAISLYTDVFLARPSEAQASTKRVPRPSLSSLKRHVRVLVGTRLPRRSVHVATLDKVAAYIFGHWKKLGLSPRYQTYKVEGRTYRNVRVLLGPRKGARVVVGAHYDVCGDQDGADDNASGVAGLLALSQLLVKHKPKLKSPLELVAYTLEEPPHFRTKAMGSYIHAKSLHQDKITVKAMMSLEMIGYFSDKPGSQRFPSMFLRMLYPDKGNFIAVVTRADAPNRRLADGVLGHMRKGSPLPAHALKAPAAMKGIDFSDHLNYWSFGFPAVMITDTAFFRNPHYHKASDKIDTLDFSRMAQVVQGVYAAVLAL